MVRVLIRHHPLDLYAPSAGLDTVNNCFCNTNIKSIPGNNVGAIIKKICSLCTLMTKGSFSLFCFEVLHFGENPQESHYIKVWRHNQDDVTLNFSHGTFLNVCLPTCKISNFLLNCFIVRPRTYFPPLVLGPFTGQDLSSVESVYFL